MSKQITIRNDLYDKMKESKEKLVQEPNPPSFSDIVDFLYNRITFLEKEIDSLQEATVTQEGRITKTLAGKTILYKVKE